MSIGWTDINPVLVEVFTEIARDTTNLTSGFSAEWKEGPRAFTSPQQGFSLLLKVISVSGIGEDETRREMVDDEIIETQVGQRRFTLQVQVIFPNHTDEQWAFAVTERIRTRLMRPRIIARLHAVDVAVHRVQQAVKVSFKDHGRIVSAANMDVMMGTVVNDTDDIPAGWIQYVVATGHLQDTSGDELPSPPNWTDHEIPTIPDP